MLADRVACGAWRLRRAVEIKGAAFVEEERDRREHDAMFPKDRDERCMIGFCAEHLAVGGQLLNLTRYEAAIERGMFQVSVAKILDDDPAACEPGG